VIANLHLEFLVLLPFLWIGWNLVAVVSGWFVLAIEAGRSPTPNADDIGMLARETMTRALLLLSQPLGALVSDRKTPGNAEIVLVPEPRWSGASMWPLATHLRSRGYKVSVVVPKGQTLDERAEDLAAHIPPGPTTLIGHGVGGLVAGWVARHYPACGVGQVIGLCTPWGGSRLSVLLRDPLNKEVSIGNVLLSPLDHCPAPTTLLLGGNDPWTAHVLPPKGVEQVLVEHLGHAEALTSGRVFRAISTLVDAHRSPE